MDNMTDYKEKYEKAITHAKDILKHIKNMSVITDKSAATVNAIEYIFPELEDKDKKIRDDLLNFLYNTANGKTTCISTEIFGTWAAWVEKSCHNKSNEDIEVLKLIKIICNELFNGTFNISEHFNDIKKIEDWVFK